jgi:hypothetical protein
MPVSIVAILAVTFGWALAFVIPFLAVRLAKAKGYDGHAPRWAGIAIGLAYIAGHLGIAMPSFPPGDVTDRIPLLALIAAILGLFRIRFSAYFAMTVLTYVIMLGPILSTGDFDRSVLGWLVAVSVVSALAMYNLACLDSPPRRVELSLGLIVLACGTGLVLLLSNSAVLFQLSMILAVVVLAALLGEGKTAVGGGVMVIGVVLMSLIVEGFVYAFLPTTPAMLLAASPAVLWLMRIKKIAHLGPKTKAAIGVGLMLVPVTIAVALVWMNRSTDASGY